MSSARVGHLERAAHADVVRDGVRARQVGEGGGAFARRGEGYIPCSANGVSFRRIGERDGAQAGVFGQIDIEGSSVGVERRGVIDAECAIQSRRATGFLPVSDGRPVRSIAEPDALAGINVADHLDGRRAHIGARAIERRVVEKAHLDIVGETAHESAGRVEIQNRIDFHRCALRQILHRADRQAFVGDGVGRP